MRVVCGSSIHMLYCPIKMLRILYLANVAEQKGRKGRNTCNFVILQHSNQTVAKNIQSVKHGSHNPWWTQRRHVRFRGGHLLDFSTMYFSINLENSQLPSDK